MRYERIPSLLAIAFAISALFVAAFMAASALPVQDLAQYWAAAHLVKTNPYSYQLVSDFEKSAGISSNALPLVIKNPPWAILFILPLGLFGYHVAFAVWAVFSVVVVAGCALAAWNLYNSPPSLAPALLSLFFGPTVVLLMLGQWTVLVLLGVTLFLTLAARKKDWYAGASLLLVLGKPHVALLFLLAVTLWTIQYKRWVIALSAILALAASNIAIIAINPHIFTQFLERTRLVVHETESYPNVGGMLYVATGKHALALLPQLIGIAWLLFYWWKHCQDWDWKSDGLLVLAVSVACSYYSYPYDEILALPALIVAYAVGNRRIFLTGFLVANLGYASYIFKLAGTFGFTYMFLWWTASAWLITYILARSPRFSLESKAEANART
jgi:hypothetical protein